MASRRSTSPRAIARRVAQLTMLQAQMRIELREVKPLVWRRILVPENVTLAKLHVILQAAMGWTYGHLHEYTVGRQRYGMPDDEWPDDEPVIDERRVRLKSLIEDRVRRIRYLYDFGDNWEHDVRIEDLVLPRAGAPLLVCTAGENACPPQDVGGPPGYEEFLAALADPNHQEHASMTRWIGRPFDAAAFDLAEINERLGEIKV
jgi:hypothetical protein